MNENPFAQEQNSALVSAKADGQAGTFAHFPRRD